MCGSLLHCVVRFSHYALGYRASRACRRPVLDGEHRSWRQSLPQDVAQIARSRTPCAIYLDFQGPRAVSQTQLGLAFLKNCRSLLAVPAQLLRPLIISADLSMTASLPSRAQELLKTAPRGCQDRDGAASAFLRCCPSHGNFRRPQFAMN